MRCFSLRFARRKNDSFNILVYTHALVSRDVMSCDVMAVVVMATTRVGVVSVVDGV